MTMGPLPMIRTDRMLLSLGIFFLAGHRLREVEVPEKEESDCRRAKLGHGSLGMKCGL